jgi:hypothetical protein
VIKHYLYISRAKLDLYLPQVQGRRGDLKVTGGIKAGPLSGSIEKTLQPATGDVNDMQALLQALSRKHEIGTLDDEPRPFVQLSGVVRSLIEGETVLFGGQISSANGNVHTVLVCSLAHMIGGTVAGPAPGNPSEDLGQLKAARHKTSSSDIGFSRALWDLIETKMKIEEAGYDPEADLIRRRERNQLSDAERQAISRRKWTNGLVSLVDPPGFERIISSMILKLLIYPFILVLVGGRRHYKVKAAALKSANFYAGVNVDDAVTRERLELLKSVRNVARSIDAPGIPFEAVAIRLVDDFIGDERVLLASPFYLARQLM